MVLNKKLSTKTFIISQLLILITGLVFLASLYYILDVQYQVSDKLYSPSGGPVTTAPVSLTLDLQQPDEDSLVFKTPLLLIGKTAPNSSVLITDENDDQVIVSKSDGSFSATLALNAGVNKITVVVFDATGEQRSTERTVYYSQEKL